MGDSCKLSYSPLVDDDKSISEQILWLAQICKIIFHNFNFNKMENIQEWYLNNHDYKYKLGSLENLLPTTSFTWWLNKINPSPLHVAMHYLSAMLFLNYVRISPISRRVTAANCRIAFLLVTINLFLSRFHDLHKYAI